jgi:phytoene desaturase
VTKTAVIIGSGVGGLATACRLATLGFQVSVMEANEYPGGKLTEISNSGFRFDAGPSLFTMPQFLDQVFEAAGKNPRDYYRYHRLEKSCHYFFEDETYLEAWADVQKFSLEVETKLGLLGQEILDYLQQSKEIYESAGHIFLENSLHRWDTWLRTDVLKALPKIPSLGLFSSMHERNRSSFRDPRLVQLFDRYATYNGSNPYRAPGILTSIPHLEFNVGTFLPEGGMHAITQALYQLATDLGVTFHFNLPADKIETSDGRAAGVRAGGKYLEADIVISNLDVYPTYRKLLPHLAAPEKILAQERSSSALIFYWGVSGSFPQLDVHNILFSADYAREFKHLFDDHTLTDDPTVYINITSKKEPTDAPPGAENWFVMINAPANQGQDWDKLIPAAQQHIVRKINRLLHTDIESRIRCEQVLDPRLIEHKTGSFRGSLYGTSSNNRMAAFLRHPNFTRKIPNLFFCGGSVHPGGGIPLCLMSAKITSALIAKQFAS